MVLTRLFFSCIKMHMKHRANKNGNESNIRKMLVRQCVIAARIGDDDQRRDALAFKQIIEGADIRQPDVAV